MLPSRNVSQSLPSPLSTPTDDPADLTYRTHLEQLTTYQNEAYELMKSGPSFMYQHISPFGTVLCIEKESDEMYVGITKEGYVGKENEHYETVMTTFPSMFLYSLFLCFLYPLLSPLFQWHGPWKTTYYSTTPV